MINSRKRLKNIKKLHILLNQLFKLSKKEIKKELKSELE